MGSSGDVFPLLSIASQMKKRGYRPYIIASPVFEKLVRENALEFIALGSEQDYFNTLNDPDLWNPARGFNAIAKHGIVPFMPELFDIIRNFSPQDTLIASSVMLFAARMAQEKYGYRMATIQLQPSLLRSVFDPPALQTTPLPGWFSPALVRAYYYLIDKLAIDPLIKQPLNRFREKIGLQPVDRPFNHWMFSPQKNICLFPDWFATRQPDWPVNTCQTGFIEYNSGKAELGSYSNNFLAAGSPPLVFTAGTSMRQAASFFENALSACRQNGYRAIFLTRFKQQVPPDLPDTIRHFEFIPLKLLLPHASAFIYHGGIGSMAQALAAGVPQLVMPMSQDQPDNAARISRLGVGKVLPPEKFTPQNISAALDEILNNPKIEKNCEKLANKIDFEQALAATCDCLETLAVQGQS